MSKGLSYYNSPLPSGILPIIISEIYVREYLGVFSDNLYGSNV